MKQNKLCQILLLTGTLLLTTACNDKPSTETTIPPESSTVEEVKLKSIIIETANNSKKLTVGGTLQLTAKAEPATAPLTVSWSTSDPTVATVSETGLVTGVKEGNVIIKATSKENTGIFKEIALVVDPKPEVLPTSITITSEEGKDSIEVNKTLKLSAEVTPSEANQSVTWSSENEEIATVSFNGEVRGQKEGEVNIIATSKVKPDITAKFKVTVTKAVISHSTDWDKQPFKTHDEFIATENEEFVKIKGTVTHIMPEYQDDNGETIYNYYLQNGTDGFFVKGQNKSLGVVELGKSYEVGGKKDNYRFTHSVKFAEYLKPIEEVLPVTVNDISSKDTFTIDSTIGVLGSKIEASEAIVTILPTANDLVSTSGYNITLNINGAEIDIRVNRNSVTEEVYKAIGEKVATLLPNQKVKVSGFMSAFGRGKKGNPQIEIVDPNGIEALPLSDSEKANLALSAIKLPYSVADVETLELPKSVSGVEGLSLTWTSDNDAINAENGKITYKEKDAHVKLTMTATAGESVVTKDYIVTVLSELDTYYTEVAKLDFEDALPATEDTHGCSPTKSSYADGNVTLDGHEWALNSTLIGGDSSDRREGQFGGRMQAKNEDATITLLEGINFDTLEFLLGTYGNNVLNSLVKVSYAVGESTEFTTLDRDFYVYSYDLNKVRVTLPVEAEDLVKVRISLVNGTGERINFDNIRLLKTNA